MGQPSTAEMGSRSKDRDHALADDSVCRILAAGTPWRIRSAGYSRLRALCELDRAAPNLIGDAPAGNFLLGPAGLPGRRCRFSPYRAAGTHVDPPGTDLFGP